MVNAFHTGIWRTLCLLAFLAITASGCTPAKYRLQADHDAYSTIAERNGDPRWSTTNFGIEPDPRSRHFDPYDPDHSPMPLDDPTSHRYMHCVNGKKGWKYWHDNGDRFDLENPAWRESLGEYVDLAEDGAVKLDVDSALRLAYVHSSSHQSQLETLYLSSLDVTEERFRLDTLFFGGYDASYAHDGSVIPPQLSYSTLLNRFVITPAIDGAGVENNRLAVGRPFAADPALQARKRFATAGELVVGFANSFVFEFTGGDTNLTASLANFSFIQPLLRGAGRDIALAQLTLEERILLANLRAYGQYRQGLYTQVAIGELGVTGPQRSTSSTTLQSFSGTGSVSGYLGLLQQLQQIRNAKGNLKLQERTLDRLNALYKAGLMNLVQVNQFKQSVKQKKSELLNRTNALELALDNYKTSTLGLPASLPVQLDQSLISPFQLFPREATPILKALLELQHRVTQLVPESEVEEMNQLLADCAKYVEPVKVLFAYAEKELDRMDAIVPEREKTMDEEDRDEFELDRLRLRKTLVELKTRPGLGFDASVAKLKSLKEGLNEETRRETLRGTTIWVGAFLQVVERLSLVPAEARLQLITVESVDLDAEEAFHIALANRLDFMNGRAALVDQWRLIQVNADALQSMLNITASGDLRTARNNPVSFRAPTGSLQMGLEFDAPFTRLLERNAYRESLIQYQRSRRSFIQSRDSLEKGLRALVRNLETARQQLEIQREAVTIAMQRVDQTQLSLNPPRPPVAPGVRPPINRNAADQLLGAQSSLQTTQNNFLAAWLSHYATKLRLYRELGIMQLDQDGRWIEKPIEEFQTLQPNDDGIEELLVPPLPELLPADGE